MRTFIIGAGASVSSGLPTSMDICERIQRPTYMGFEPLFIGNPRDYNELINIIQEVLISEYSDINNFLYPEDLVDYYFDILNDEYRPDFSVKEDESLGRYITNYFKCIWESEKAAIRCNRYNNHQILTNYIQNNDILVSFNYDSLLERKMKENGKFSEEQYYDIDNNNAKFYKPHKSFNMLRCENCNRIIIDWSLQVEPGLQYYASPASYKDCNCITSGDRRLLTIMSPPTVKKAKTSLWQYGWKIDNDEMQSILNIIRYTDELYFVGYSMPLQDKYFASVIIEAIHQSVDNKKIVIVNKNKDSAKNVANNIVYLLLSKKMAKLQRMYCGQGGCQSQLERNWSIDIVDGCIEDINNMTKRENLLQVNNNGTIEIN